MKKKLYKHLILGSFYFFLIKGILWLVVFTAAALGIGKIF